MKFSKTYIQTLKEAPKDASLPSHIYLLRAGFIYNQASGLYSFLPLAKRVLNKIENIVREEMDKSGALEVLVPFVSLAKLWEESGRLDKFGKELLRFKDRKNSEFVLGPTHEEAFVQMLRDNIKSYKQLPLNLYQINTKFRDELRPRFGLLRAREFIMKDAYSFHSSEEDLQREFELMELTYTNILNNLGLKFKIVDADSGAIGGSGSKEFMIICDNGEDTISYCDNCNYAANVETGVSLSDNSHLSPPEAEFNIFLTKAKSSIKDVSNFFNVDEYFLIKAIVKKAVFDNDESKIVVFFLRASDKLQELKALNALGANDIIDIDEAELKENALCPGYIGLIGLNSDIISFVDNDLKDGKNLITGANKENYHYVGVSLEGRGLVYKDLKEVKEGDLCIKCKNKLKFSKGIEIGHIFKLGIKYSKSLKGFFLDNDAKQKPYFMGCYGFGVSRMLAAFIEQNNDLKGCIWTKKIAPYEINILISNIKDELQNKISNDLYLNLKNKGFDLILDDRNERFGFKIKDAELIGFPYTIIIGKGIANKEFEILDRKNDIKHKFKYNNEDSILEIVLEFIK